MKEKKLIRIVCSACKNLELLNENGRCYNCDGEGFVEVEETIVFGD